MYYSLELKELIAKSRTTAINMGYDFISTIHLFIAACDTNEPGSIRSFAFTHDDQFEKFKSECVLGESIDEKIGNLSLPLTLEAEMAIRNATTQRKLYQQTVVYPSHVFLAALKDNTSILYECFQGTENSYEKLVQFYQASGEFEKSKKPNNGNFLTRILKVLTGK